jgi:hypothetical protein
VTLRSAEDDDTVDRDEYENVDIGGEFSGRGIDSGSTFAVVGNFAELVPGLLFVFECRFGLGFPRALDTDNVLKGEYLGLKLVGGGRHWVASVWEPES